MGERAHLPWDDPRVDTAYVLALALKLPDKEADMNAVALLDDDANCHWPDGPAKNHFTWIFTGRYDKRGREVRRALTEAERNTPMAFWPARKYLMLRRAEFGGRKPALCSHRQKQANRLGVKIDWELKSYQYTRPAVAARFVRSIKKVGGKWAVMTLVTMRGWGAKLKAFKLAGAPKTALLPHGVKKTLAIRTLLAMYGKYIDAYWGSWG